MSEKVLGQRYKLIERTHASRFSEWYHAFDTFLSRHVTIKIDQVDQLGDRLDRWKKAAQRAAGLVHPYVVPIYDMGRDGDSMYLVMERLEGKTLQQMIHERQRFGMEQFINQAEGLAEALAYAHRLGICHGSLSSKSVWWNGVRAKIADFCVEGIYDEEKEPSEKADLEQFGRLLDEWLVGTVPLTDARRQMLESVIDRAIGRREPRYLDMREMARDLKLLAGETTPQVMISPSAEQTPMSKAAESLSAKSDRLPKRKRRSRKRLQLPTFLKGAGEKAKAIMVSTVGAVSGVIVVIILTLWALSQNFFSSHEGHTGNHSAAENSGTVTTTAVQPDDSNAEKTQKSSTVSTNEGTAPNLIGLTQKEAQDQLIAAGYRYYYEIRQSDKPSGIVFHQNPPAGTALAKGSQVQFWVSQ